MPSNAGSVSGAVGRCRDGGGMPRDYPLTFYKYRYFDEQGYHLKLLSDNEMYFSSPQSFNDPFDCRIRLRYDLLNSDEIRPLVERNLKQTKPNLNPLRRKRIASKLAKTNQHTNRNKLDLLQDHFVDERIGLFCLSANPRSIITWSHYSSNHRGFCVGFSRNELIKMSAHFFDKLNKSLVIHKVDYSESLPVIHPIQHNEQERMKMQLCTKSDEWKYENEYRMIFQEGVNSYIHYGDVAIKRVILGCKISNINTEQIINILKSKNKYIPLYQSIQSGDEFKLHFKQVKY